MLVVNSNSQNVFQTSGESIFDTRYPDFNQLLFIPFLGKYSVTAMSQLPTITISNTTVNFISVPISQAQSLSINSSIQNCITYPTGSGSLSIDFTTVSRGQFKGGEIVGKKCYAIVRHIINYEPNGGFNSGSPKIDVSLLHTDGTTTSIGTMTSSLSGNVENFELYFEGPGVEAIAGDRLLLRVYNYTIYQNINQKLCGVRFGDNCNCAKGPMTPIQISVD